MKTYIQLIEELGLGESSRARKLHTRKMGGFRYGTGTNPVTTGKLLDAPSGSIVDSPPVVKGDEWKNKDKKKISKDSVFKKIDKEAVGKADPQAQKVYGIRQGDKEYRPGTPMGYHGYNPKDPKDVAATKLAATNTPEQETRKDIHVSQIQSAARLRRHLLQQQLKAKKNK